MLVKVEVYNDGQFWCARGIGEDIFTQAKTVDDLYKNIHGAVTLHFEDRVTADQIEILIITELKPLQAPAASNRPPFAYPFACFAEELGYEVIRKAGSHLHARKWRELGEHNLTVPHYDILAEGILRDLLPRISFWNSVPTEALIQS